MPANHLILCHPLLYAVKMHLKTCTRIFITALFTVLQNWKISRCPSTTELWHIHIMRYHAARKMNKLLHYNMEEFDQYDVKWKNSDTNEYILHGSIYINLKKTPVVLEVKIMVTSGEEEVGNDEDQGIKEAFRVLVSLSFFFLGWWFASWFVHFLILRLGIFFKITAIFLYVILKLKWQRQWGIPQWSRG